MIQGRGVRQNLARALRMLDDAGENGSLDAAELLIDLYASGEQLVPAPQQVQYWLGHASIQTTAMYDKRENRPEDSPSYRVSY